MIKISLNHLVTSSAVQFTHSVMSDSLWPHGLQRARLPYPSPTPGAYSNSCPLSPWCHPTISSSVFPFSSHFQSTASILAWRIPWTEEPGRLQTMGPQRVRHGWVTNTFTFKIINTYTVLSFSGSLLKIFHLWAALPLTFLPSLSSSEIKNAHLTGSL